MDSIGLENSHTTQYNYDLVDLNKFLFAICLVALHTKALSSCLCCLDSICLN